MDLNTTIIVVCWIAICLFALKANSDLFSPTKFYLLFFSIYHLDILFKDYPVEHEAVIMIYLLMALVLILQESSARKAPKPREFYSNISQPPPLTGLRFATVLVWVFTIPAIISKIYLIGSLDGIVNFVNTLNDRANVWRGAGPFLVMVKSIMVIQIIYFVIGVIWRVKNAFWWMIFCAHLAVTLTIALLTGSRSTILMNFVIMFVFSHYFLKRQTAIKTAVIAVLAISAAGGLAIARQTVKLGAGDHLTSPHVVIRKSSYAASHAASTKMFKYGLIPLDFIFSSEPQNLQYGLSILTPLTNIVPRKLWPNKFDTASMAMNKEYIEDRGAGPYQYPTGIIGFGVMNFGWGVGIAFGLALFWFLMTTVVNFYNRIFTEPIKPSLENGLIALTLIYSSLSVTNLMVGEFANIIVNFSLTQLLPILAFMTVYTSIEKFIDPSHKKNNSHSKRSK